MHTYHFSIDYGISKGLKNVECFNYVDSMITDVARCTREIKSRIAMAKAEFKEKSVFFGNLFLDLRKKTMKSYGRSTAVHAAETRTLWQVGQKYLLSS